MADDTENDDATSTAETAVSGDELADDESATMAELFEFAADQAASEDEEFAGDVPKHADRLIVSTAANLQKTLVNVHMTEASENADDPNEEAVASALEEDAVDILLAMGALQYEYDLDIAGALEDRVGFMEDFKAFEEAMREAEDQDEQMEVMDEHMTEEIQQKMGQGMMAQDAPTIEPGDNVDSEDYDHDEEGRAYV